MFDVISIKGIIIGCSVRKFDVDGQITRLHKLQVHKQSACSSVAVDKGMDALKLNMEPGELPILCFIIPIYRNNVESAEQYNAE